MPGDMEEYKHITTLINTFHFVCWSCNGTWQITDAFNQTLKNVTCPHCATTSKLTSHQEETLYYIQVMLNTEELNKRFDEIFNDPEGLCCNKEKLGK